MSTTKVLEKARTCNIIHFVTKVRMLIAHYGLTVKYPMFQEMHVKQDV